MCTVKDTTEETLFMGTGTYKASADCMHHFIHMHLTPWLYFAEMRIFYWADSEMLAVVGQGPEE